MCFDCHLLSCDLQLQETFLTKDKRGNSMLQIAMAVEDRKAGAVELVLTIAQDILTDIQVKGAACFPVFGVGVVLMPLCPLHASYVTTFTFMLCWFLISTEFQYSTEQFLNGAFETQSNRKGYT